MALHKPMWVGRARTLAFCVLAVLVAASIGMLLAANPAHAATFTVNRTADTPDANLANAACDVNASVSGNQCTLRAAIQESNDTDGADEIRFNIVSTANVKTISPASELPIITEQVTIDGYTQPGASANTLATGNDAVLKVQLNGTNAVQPGGASGIEIRASNSTIKGLVINRFIAHGVIIRGSGATDNNVEGNFIGTNASGTADLGNAGAGVVISFAPNNTIGGTEPAQRNVISGNGNGFGGVHISGDEATTGNKVQGNFIGTTADGTGDLGNGGVNGGNGVFIAVPGNTIGGTASGARNVISGNSANGVLISGSEATLNKVEGNRIGTRADGTGDLGNDFDGVHIASAPDNTIGGTTSGAGNTISGNGDDGITIFNSAAPGDADFNKVEGNNISGNDNDGVVIAASNNTVGGTTSGARNLISANQDDGVEISSNLATDNQVLGNFVGTDTSGTADLGNSNDGVEISSGADDNTVGGTTSGARNLISGNGGDGVHISGDEATTGNTVQGNFIGTTVSGNAALGNSGEGVEISQAADNTIGGTTAAARNIISANIGDGVVIFGTDATGNKVQGNFIGTGANGTTALGNDDGVAISSGSDSTIGSAIGTTAGGNRIAHNDQDGVFVGGGLAVGNRILSNSIHSNGETGIDLVSVTQDEFEVTANDEDDPDGTTSPISNHLQNFPVITTAVRSSSTGNTTITGTINSNPQQFFTIQCFVAAPDPSGHGEGRTFLVQTTTTTNANGNGNFVCITPGAKAGQAVTATATNTSGTAPGTSIGDTSEFSLNRTIISGS